MKCHRCGKDNPAEIHTCTPLALRLVDKLMDGMNDEHWNQLTADAAAELRRLHAENEALREMYFNSQFEVGEVRSENEALRQERARAWEINHELREFTEEVRRTGDTRLASMAIAALARASEAIGEKT